MRRHWLTRGTMALALAAGCWTSTCGADDAPAKSSWGAKLWPWSAKKASELPKDADAKTAASSKLDKETVANRLRAEANWIRRAEVCQKLRQIAYDTNDTELERFADRLDQRAWDAYFKQTNGGAIAAESGPAERIGIDFNSPDSVPKTMPTGPASKNREVRP